MKIKINFSISQKLSGEIKRISVIGGDVHDCWNRINTALNIRKHYEINVLNVYEVEDSFPSGLFQADALTIVSSYRSVASIIPGAALLNNNEPHSSNS